MAFGQVVNFDAPGGLGGVNYSGAGAAFDSGNYWNPIVKGGTTIGGLLSDGATASSITLTDKSPSNYNPGQGAQGTPAGLEAPFLLENNGAVVMETLNNVPAGIYNLYLYGKNSNDSGGDNGDRGTTFTVSVGGTSYGTQSTINSITTSFTKGNDYVEFINLIVETAGTISFTYTANTAATGSHNPQTEGDFNGLQLVNLLPMVKVNPTQANITVGGSTQLVATVSGVTPFWYQWQKGTNGVFVDSVNEGDVSGSTTNVLSFSSAALLDAADYRLVVTNIYGAITSQVATVTVSLSPSIITQPGSATLGFGNALQLTATAIGQPPLTYQWQKGTNDTFIDTDDTGDVSGSMTNDLSFTMANLSDAADYRLIVNNAYGAVTSQVATVTVLLKPLVGASVPWTEYEAETGTVDGGATIASLIPPLSNPVNGEPVIESSGAAYVALTGTGQSVSWTNNSGQNITALNIRIQIPDAPGGYGITNTLDLYVDGIFRQAIIVNSAQTYVYAGINNDKNPADGNPTRVWDEYPFFVTGAAIAPGSTIMLKKDLDNSASFYNIDLIDLETPPAPFVQPTNSLSIVSYGAVSNNPSVDNTSAIQNCINAAQSQGKSVWIPSGIFYMGKSTTSGLNVPPGVTVNGAGMWYSTLYSNPSNPSSGGQMIGGVGCTLQDFAMDCNSISAGCASATGMSGSNWTVNRVWFRHTSLAVWGGGDHGLVANTRVNNTWSDGENMNNFSGNSTTGQYLTETNNFLRFTGDDAMAVNGTESSGHTPMNNIFIANNTIVQTAGRIVVYGGNNVIIKNNFAHDLVQNDGIQVGYHQQTASITNVLVEGNVVLRCGSPQFGGVPGMLLGTQSTSYDDNGTQRPYIDSGITAIGNTIIDPYYGGLQIQICSNVDFENNIIISPGAYGVQIADFATGNAVVDDNVVSGLSLGQPMYYNSSSGYTATSATATFVRPPVEAVSYNNLSSANAFREICNEGGQDLCSLYNDDYAVYNQINLNGINRFVARVASADNGGFIEIHLDSPTGTLIGNCAVPVTGGWQTWDTVSCNVSGASGYHDIYLVFTGDSGALFNVEWFALLGNGNRMEAASYNDGSEIQTENCSEGGLDVANITNGSYAVYHQLNLTGTTSFNARAASGGAGGNIEIHLDSPTGTVIGTCAVPSTGDWQTWETVACALNTSASGYHGVYLVFTGGDDSLFNLEWLQFQFNSASASTANLALNRPVTVSSVVDSSPGANAVDGNLNTRWSSAYSDPQWIYVDLGTNYNITAVTLAWESAYGKTYQIQVSTNATTWATIYNETNGTGGTENLTGLSGFGRYVRMYGTQRGTIYGYSLYEFEVFGGSPEPEVTMVPSPLFIQSFSPTQGLLLQWPDDGNRELPSQPTVHYTTDLTPPVIWELATNLPTYSNGQWQINLPMTNDRSFYRLQ
ncbi:MAG TPA: carbohydrate-binding protein [Verrucomicrobiae bacterium]|nr:carbohydrate-binding protein [Verrucomicrobiae bacterium]